MLIKEITYITEFEDGTNDHNVHLSVEVENGNTYIVEVGTTKNSDSLMEKYKLNYFLPGIPFILVKELKKEIIEETIKVYPEENEGFGWENKEKHVF